MQKNKNGFGLVGTLVAIAITAIAMAALMSMLDSLNKGQRNIAIKSSFQATAIYLRDYLNQPDNCKNLLPSTTVISRSASPTTHGTSVSNISRITRIPAAVGGIEAIFDVNASASPAGALPAPYSITSISVEGIGPTPTDGMFRANLVVNGLKGGDVVHLGGNTLAFSMPLLISTELVGTNRVFEGCSSSDIFAINCPPGTFLRQLSSTNPAVACAPGIEPRNSDPANPVPGQIWLRTDL